jgi:hypothetical protein
MGCSATREEEVRQRKYKVINCLPLYIDIKIIVLNYFLGNKIRRFSTANTKAPY